MWGVPGAGKTVSAVYLMQKARAQGRRVIANFHSTCGLWEFGGWEAMMDADNALCVVDEAGVWFPARQYHEQTKEDLGVFMQSRKSGLDLLLIAQHPDQIDKAIRDVCHVFQKAIRLGPLNLIKWHDWSERKKKGYRYQWYLPSQRLLESYYTEEAIGNRSGQNNRLGRTTEYGKLAWRWRVSPTAEVITIQESRSIQAQLRGYRVTAGMIRKGRFLELPPTLKIREQPKLELAPVELPLEIAYGTSRNSKSSQSRRATRGTREVV
jgi:hypothetical protein